MKLKVIKECVDQDTKQIFVPCAVVEHMSDFERGRHLAEGNMVPIVDGPEIENQVQNPAGLETRQPKKNRRARAVRKPA